MNDDELEIDEYWARIAATPWHRRNLLDTEQLLVRPVSWPGRIVYYAALPVLLALIILL